MESSTGYYDLRQLSSQKGTARQKAHTGVFPWSWMTLRRMWARGDFPKPILWGGKNVWKKEVINEYARLVGQGMANAEAAIQAQATVA